MISVVEALNYRCLRYVRQPLAGFHVLVGPNASGKTTFLDVVGFLHDLVAKGLDAAIGSRTFALSDLVWWHGEGGFELAVEARIPDVQRELLKEPEFDTVRYEVAICFNSESEQVEIAKEKGFLKVAENEGAQERSLFPMHCEP